MYLAYLEEADQRLGEALDWPMARMLSAGFGVAARQHYTVYRTADQALLARARARQVWVDLKTRRPIRIPQVFLAALAANIATE